LYQHLFSQPVLAGAFNSFDKGITLGSSIYKGNELGMCRGDSPVCTTYAYLVVQWIVMMIAGLYFDQVLPSASSVRRHPLFFLGFKRAEHAKSGVTAKKKHGEAKGDDAEIDLSSPVPEDIAHEQSRVRALMDGEQSQVRGIVVSHLDKVYPGTNPPVHAVRDLSFVARMNEVTGIIGGNGAGKSTTFRMMTGSIEPTAGNIVIDGNSVITDMARVQSAMGVCFQQDILWDSLTIEEHLCFFARVRGIEKKEIPAIVEASLQSVDLTFARKRRAGQCSGGMRRRLSVAIALLGNPSCCLLDEPTTGLDPQTRERVWQAIDAAKQSKTILLTTHSMEEAQKLCDRIGLMSKGSLKCIGQPEELRLRLGRGYNLSVSVPESTAAAMHELIMNISSESIVETALAGNLKYSIPRSVPASKIFNAITANRERLQISDWGLAQSSLEDVFLNVTRDEAAIRETKRTVDDVSIV
jgi:ABC-type multidrug transport system ATPase subunit